jgi:hypothetical protein
MQRIIGLMLIALLISINIIAQKKRNAVWVTGTSGNKIDFNNNSIITSTGVYFPFKYFVQGTSCISDTNGNLILASDGFNLYDVFGGVILNGDSIVPKNYYTNYNGFSTSSQTSIILPMANNKFYFVTPTFSDAQFADCLQNNDCYFDLLLNNLVDMNGNGGLGEVTQRMVPLVENGRMRKTQMMACQHGNGKDWWLLKNEGDSANVHTFLFTQDSVIDKGVQTFAEPVWGVWDIRGQSTFNSDGTKFATTSHGSSTGQIFLADFDRCWGKLSNPQTIIMPTGLQYLPWDSSITEKLSVGLAFSPNNKFLYVISMSNVYQYDLLDKTWFHIAGVDSVYPYANVYETTYMGFDNKLYIGNVGTTSQHWSRIDNPDVKGAGCNFCPRCLRIDSLGAFGYLGTPPCQPNYGMGAVAGGCWPLDSPNITVENDMVVYPNPAITLLTIKNRKGKKKVLYDCIGQMIYSTLLDEINVSSFAKGIYFIKCEGETKKVIVE